MTNRENPSRETGQPSRAPTVPSLANPPNWRKIITTSIAIELVLVIAMVVWVRASTTYVTNSEPQPSPVVVYSEAQQGRFQEIFTEATRMWRQTRGERLRTADQANRFAKVTSRSPARFVVYEETRDTLEMCVVSSSGAYLYLAMNRRRGFTMHLGVVPCEPEPFSAVAIATGSLNEWVRGVDLMGNIRPIDIYN